MTLWIGDGAVLKIYSQIDINGISDPVEICKNIISAQILIYQPVGI